MEYYYNYIKYNINFIIDEYNFKQKTVKWEKSDNNTNFTCSYYIVIMFNGV